MIKTFFGYQQLIGLFRKFQAEATEIRQQVVNINGQERWDSIHFWCELQIAVVKNTTTTTNVEKQG